MLIRERLAAAIPSEQLVTRPLGSRPIALLACDAVYRQLYAPLVRAAYAITFDLEVAREICHEAFMRFWERRDRLNPVQSERQRASARTMGRLPGRPIVGLAAR